MKPNVRPANGDPLDSTIARVELLYRSLTGRDAPPQGESPFAPIPPEKEPERHVTEQIDQLVGDLDRLSSRIATPGWVPALCAWEGPNELRLTLDVPGVPRESIELRLVDATTLEVSGERPLRSGGEDAEQLVLRHAERARGRFRRVIALPGPVNPEQLNARLADGELEIRLPKPGPGDDTTKKIRIA